MSNYKEGVDYQYVNPDNMDDLDGDDKVTAIGLLLDDYKGVLYHYHKARVVEDGGVARLQFGYTILYPGEHDIDDLTKDEKLHTIMGDILSDIIMAQKDEQIRTDNSQKLNIQ